MRIYERYAISPIDFTQEEDVYSTFYSSDFTAHNMK